MSQIAKAASVILARGAGSSELYVVRRAEALRFLGGFVAFPGGKVSPEDRELADPGGKTAIPEQADSTSTVIAADRFVTAARELFEETGVLVAPRPDGSFPSSGSALQYLRRKLISEELTFKQVLSRLGVVLRADDFVSLGGITTPPFVPVRFETVFFLATLPPNQQAEVWPGELDEGRWATAREVLQCWTAGEYLVSPPTVAILQAIIDLPAEAIPDRLRQLIQSHAGDTLHKIYFAPDVQMIPLQTMALPPSTHTNAYLIGRNPSYLLDPGCASAEEQNRLFALLDSVVGRPGEGAAANGRSLSAVVLTHHHPDHIGAANACAQRYQVPIYAHPITAKKLEAKVKVDREIQAGERLDLGVAPDGRSPWHLEAILTPGHAPGHLVFYEPHYRLLFAGDMVSTLSSIVIAPPDGDLAVYLDSLRRLQGLDVRLLLPAHGSPSPRPKQTIEEAILHRRTREEQLLAALSPVPRSVPDLARDLYKGLPPVIMRFAELQVLAGLHKLRSEGRAHQAPSQDGELWAKQVLSTGC